MSEITTADSWQQESRNPIEIVLLTCIERPDRTYSDLDRACILARSLERNLDLDNEWIIHVVAADREIDEVSQRLSAYRLNYLFHPHSELLPEAPTAQGWRLQQFLKLLISRSIATPFYLSIDSDQILTRKLRVSDLVKDGQAIFTPERREQHLSWWLGSAEILGTELVSDPVSAMSCVCMSTPVVHSLLERLFERLGHGWQYALLAREDWIEYSLYFTHAQRGEFSSLPHFPGPLLGPACSIWFPADVETWDAHAAFGGDHFFICLQSNVNLPPRLVWEMTRSYLEAAPE